MSDDHHGPWTVLALKEYVDAQDGNIRESVRLALEAKEETHKDDQWSAGQLIAIALAVFAAWIALLGVAIALGVAIWKK